jgi:hypothetical protein
MEKQLDDIETVDNDGDKEREPHMSEDVPVAREGLSSEILIHPSGDDPGVEADSKNATIDQVSLSRKVPHTKTFAKI